MEISFDRLSEFLEQQSKGIKISKYETMQDQIIYRDLSFLIPVEKSFDMIPKAIQKIKEVESIEIFDIYSGENIPQ
jgi:phenylalanyl-tRNA synthetase beta subunit